MRQPPIHRRPLAAVPLLFAIALLAAILGACTPTDRFVAGRPITPEELESIGAALRTEEDATDSFEEPGTESATDTETTREFAPGEARYWSSRSTAYHTSPDCRHLKDQKMQIGTVEDALAAGKTTQCNSCDLESRVETPVEIYTD